MKVAEFTCSGKHGVIAALAGLTLLCAQPAAAYVGPGAGLSAIGVLVALIGAVALAAVGFVWYPLKRLFRKVAPVKADTPRDGNDRPHRH